MGTRADILSVVIATRDRAPFLDGCLRSIAHCVFERGGFEVLVVDNASRDSTGSIVRQAMQKDAVPLRYVLEPRPGLAIARNAGVAHARGEHIVFLDDDAVVTRRWLSAYARQFRQEGQAVVQGRILPRFLSGRPAWIIEEHLPRFGQVDEGDVSCELRSHVHGGNLGVARRVFEAVGAFREDLGAGAMGLGEDTEFGRRVAASGFAAVYAPGAAVHHLISRDRTTRSAFLRRCYQSGRAQAHMAAYPGSAARHILGMLKALAAGVPSAVLAPDSVRHMGELAALAEYVGRVSEILRQRARG